MEGDLATDGSGVWQQVYGFFLLLQGSRYLFFLHFFGAGAKGAWKTVRASIDTEVVVLAIFMFHHSNAAELRLAFRIHIQVNVYLLTPYLKGMYISPCLKVTITYELTK